MEHSNKVQWSKEKKNSTLIWIQKIQKHISNKKEQIRNLLIGWIIKLDETWILEPSLYSSHSTLDLIEELLTHWAIKYIPSPNKTKTKVKEKNPTPKKDLYKI